MRIKARVAISCSILIMGKGGNNPARRGLQRLVRPHTLLTPLTIAMIARKTPMQAKIRKGTTIVGKTRFRDGIVGTRDHKNVPKKTGAMSSQNHSPIA